MNFQLNQKLKIIPLKKKHMFFHWANSAFKRKTLEIRSCRFLWKKIPTPSTQRNMKTSWRWTFQLSTKETTKTCTKNMQKTTPLSLPGGLSNCNRTFKIPTSILFHQLLVGKFWNENIPDIKSCRWVCLKTLHFLCLEILVNYGCHLIGFVTNS